MQNKHFKFKKKSNKKSILSKSFRENIQPANVKD